MGNAAARISITIRRGQIIMKAKKGKKNVLIVAIILVVLTLAQLFILGYKGGIGPLKFLRNQKMAKLPGNAVQYHLENVEPLADSPLKGKTICFLGSSVTNGSASLGVSMADYIGKRNDCAIIKEAVNGTTLTDKSNLSYVQRLIRKVPLDTELDILVCQLSTNDASQKMPLGSISDSKDRDAFDRATILGSMEYIIAYAQETWDCAVVIYTGTRYESEAYQAMVDSLPALREKWGICVIDLWNDPQMNAVSEEDYAFYMSDNVHPTQAGYLKWWVPVMEQTLYTLAAAQ